MAKWLIFFFIFILSASSVNAVIRINEILIDPMQKIEVLNVGESVIDISNWFLDDSGGTTYFTMPQNTSLQPNSCRVFEADFNLNKTSADTVRLFDKSAPPTSSMSALIDSFSYKASAGSGISFKRTGDATWATGSVDLGLYNLTPISCIAPEVPSPSPTIAPTAAATPTPTVAAFDYENVYISEVMVSPSEGEDEWIEFYNENNFTVTLENWYLDDQENAGSSPKKFSLEISANAYAVLELSSSIFNNDGDSVRFLNAALHEKDSVSYSTSTRGMSLGKVLIPLSNLCTQIPSKGVQNTGCHSDLLSQEKTLSPSPIPEFAPKTQDGASPIVSDFQEHSTEPLRISTQESDVLGSKISARQDQRVGNINRYFSFVALSYSLLTICSILLKMKLSA